ncbi:glycosyltransferase (plasmid) [Rhizobium sp. 32-5/1]|uniref:glycosyltransferase n=1 Tax=Rhizobium sp. 32-5/1 TaxID=3019602 RepID=UPI00240E3586|nr:glycosyltransferase [Rhizobium sp. 32-5/1]WEZ85860.1 glycosyltransferase [Rhizobium sp. 32-5/1]
MKRRIIFHIPSLVGGGAERVFVLMANEMQVRGHDVTLFVWNAQGPNAELLNSGVRLVSLELPLRGEGFGKTGTLRGLVKSAAFLRRERPDAVFSGPEFANIIMALALMAGGSSASFFPSYHAPASLRGDRLGERLVPLLTWLAVRRATKAIAVSAGVGRDLAVRGFRDEQIAIIHNPLPPTHIRTSSVHSWTTALESMGKGKVIITVGRLAPVKDHRTLLDAFSKLDLSRGYRLVIFGEGALKENLIAHAQALGVSNRTLFPGYVNDPAACYACADLFVLSSLKEGFGNVLIEAMAAGVPVVSTDAPYGPREILADSAFGRLVPVGDAAALARAMEETLASPEDPSLLRRRAADFSIDIVGDRYDALL